MVGPSDNIPSVGKAVDRVSDDTVGLSRGLSYIFSYKKFINLLNSEIENVNTQVAAVSKKADQERVEGKVIEAHVRHWQNNVEKMQDSAKEFSKIYNDKTSWRCMPFLPVPNLVSRFRLGREAVQKAKNLVELVDSGKEIMANEIAYFPPYEILPKSDTAFLNFQSRGDAYGKLWQALTVEDNSLIVGICGMPGVGKTRMAEQISEEALVNKIFDKVTRANVGSEKLDVKQIQKQIASCLGLYFKSQDSVEHRASELKNNLMNRGKILLILDDVWREIPLGVIGIPFGDGSTSKGSKILLTSRDEYVCLRNNCKQSVKIETLADNEAWDMFRNTVVAGGDNFLPDESLAKDVCSKCAGLPLLIQAVGRALKYRTQGIWEITLYRLENWKIGSVSGIRGKVYDSLKGSFHNVTEDAAPCLFLCSLYPEDDDIPIRTLIQLATGSQLVHGGRPRIRALVDILKSSSLLLEGKDNEHVKLHAAVRLVARSIAVKDPKYAFFYAACGSTLPYNTDYSYRKLLHLDLETSNFRFPDDLVCRDLHTLSLRSLAAAKPNLFPQKHGFSSGMFANLRFLALVNFSWRELFPFESLGKLESLYLNHCQLTYYGGTGVRLFPQSLETLGIGHCILPKPLDLSNLIYLSKLEILCQVVLTSNTISGLSNLEELHIPNGYEIQNGATQRWTPKLD